MTPPAKTSSAGSAPASPGTAWPVGVAFLFCWWLVLRTLWPEWSLNPQYQFGQLMPVFCLVLLALRWPDRPLPAIPSAAGRAVAMAACAAGILILAAVQPIFESNQDWRLVPAVSVASGAVVSLAFLWLLGGLPWLWHFAFPVLFILVAVPWPTPVENGVMGFLMEWNALIAVELLNWLGREAVQNGNLIALPCGMLGVEEACSGVRSLQSGIMVSLFAGEYFRLKPGSRVSLVLVALGSALLGNILRTLTLSMIASTRGIHAIEPWHDPAGFAILAGTLAAVGIAAWLLAGRRRPVLAVRDDHADLLSRLAPWRPAALGACALWIIAIGASELWYRAHERPGSSPEMSWSLAPASAAEPVKIPERTLAMLLRPEVAFSERWADEGGSRWQLFFFQWMPGRSAIQSAMSVHDPRVCLGSIGMTLVENCGLAQVRAAGFTIPFRRYIFSSRGVPLYVFQSVVKDDSPGQFSEEVPEEFSAAGRLRSVLSGRRNRGLRVLEVAIWGARNLPDAQARLQSHLENRLKSLQ